MTADQKSTCSSFAKVSISFGAGIIVTAFTMGLTLGGERLEFKEAAERTIRNEAAIRKIELQIAEDRIVSRHMLELLNEVRSDVKAIREKSDSQHQ